MFDDQTWSTRYLFVNAGNWLLEGLAAVAVAQGQADRAVRLWTAADILRAAAGALLLPLDCLYYEQVMDRAHTQLDETTYVAARNAGGAMTQKQVVAYPMQPPTAA